MTNFRRYLIVAAILVACVCVALGVLAMQPRPGVTKANLQRLREGMTFSQIEAIVRRQYSASVVTTLR